MSILSGILGPAINVATQAAGSYQGAQANKANQAQAGAIQRAGIIRQQQEQEIQRAIQARQAESAGITDKLNQLRTQQLQKEVDAPPKPQAYVPTTYEEAVKLAGDKARATAKAGAEFRQPRAPSTPNWQVIQTDDGAYQVNPETSETRPIVLPGGKQATKPRTAQEKAKSDENRLFVEAIDRAIAGLEKHPEATGPLRGRLDIADQFFDPEGTDVRADIATVGSKKVHDRSGGAVTPSEYPRLAPFIPSASDRPSEAIKKLRKLKQSVISDPTLLQSSSAGSASDLQQAWDAAAAELKRTGKSLDILGPRP